MSGFQGFPSQALSFFTLLGQNNNKEWFAEHKQEYLDFVQAPAEEFVMALGPALHAISPTIQFAPGVTRGSIMRIYRDIRFSKDKTPYKEHLGISFWDGPHKKMENPGYFLHMNAKRAYLYGGLHMFSKDILAAYRKAIAKDAAGPEIQSAIEAIRSDAGFQVDGEQYKRVPRGFDPDHEFKDLLRYKGIWSRSPRITESQLTSPDLISLCLDYAKHMAPLHHRLVKISQSALD